MPSGITPLPPEPRSGAAGTDGAAGLASTAGSDSTAPDAKTLLTAAVESFPLSRSLLEAVLADRLSDRFVCGLVWTRLGYGPAPGLEAVESGPWSAGSTTPPAWAEAFPEAPELIASRPASVRLTRSIAAPHKQLLKQQLGFGGYRIGELYPRRTRRATAVNWLLAHLAERGEALPDTGPLPPLLEPPLDPVQGHPGDLAVG